MRTSSFLPNAAAGTLLALVALHALGGTPAAHAGKCPNVQIVLDRSTSMGSTLDLFSRITAVQTALALALPGEDMLFRMGLTAFPKTAVACDSETTVLPAFGNGTAVANAVNSYVSSTIGSSSTGSAINAAASLSALRDASRPQFIILITDGSPACASTADTVAGAVNEVKQAYMATPSIATYVIGVSSLSAGDADALNQLATAGGRPLTGTTKYYAATNSFAMFSVINNVLSAIAAEVGSCSDAPSADGGTLDMSAPTDLPPRTDLSLPPTDLASRSDLASGRDLSGSPSDLSSLPDGRQPSGPAPIVDWLEPNQVTTGVGGAANIIGRNFIAMQPSSTAYLEGEGDTIPLSNALVFSDSKIQVFLSSTLRVGTYDVVVKNPDGQLGRQPGALTVIDKPAGCTCSVGGVSAPASSPAWPLAAFSSLLISCLLLRQKRRTTR